MKGDRKRTNPQEGKDDEVTSETPAIKGGGIRTEILRKRGRPTIESLRALYAARARRLEATQKDRPNGPTGSPDEPGRYLALRRELLDAERSAVLKLWQQGRITAAVYRVIERGLDLEEARIRGA